MSTTEVHPDQEAFLRYLEHLLALRKTGQLWPQAVYEALLNLPHCSWKAAPTRRYRGKQQLLYAQRPADSKAYPPDPVKGSPWGFAGTNNRGESSVEGYRRVGAEDFLGGRLINRRFVGCANWHQEPRGPFVAMVFLCEYEGEVPPHCRWYDWDRMPDRMVEGHGILAERVIRMIRSGETTPWFVDDPR